MQRKRYIRINPDLSANKIIKRFKKTDKKLKRTDGLKLVREVRKTPKRYVSEDYILLKDKKQKQIDKQKSKYKDVKIELPETPEGTYKIAKVVTKDKKKYFIKYSSPEAYKKQLDKLIQSGYGANVLDFKITFSKPINYKPFIASDFDLSFLEF